MAGKQDIARSVADKNGWTTEQASQAVDSVLAAFADLLAKGERVQLPGLGSFSVAQRTERVGINPKTGEKIAIPSRMKLVSRPSEDFALRVTGSR